MTKCLAYPERTYPCDLITCRSPLGSHERGSTDGLSALRCLFYFPLVKLGRDALIPGQHDAGIGALEQWCEVPAPFPGKLQHKIQMSVPMALLNAVLVAVSGLAVAELLDKMKHYV